MQWDICWKQYGLQDHDQASSTIIGKLRPAAYESKDNIKINYVESTRGVQTAANTGVYCAEAAQKTHKMPNWNRHFSGDNYLYNKRRYVCLSVCLFRMAGQTAGPIETKLDTRTHVHPGSVSGKVNVKVIHVCLRQ